MNVKAIVRECLGGLFAVAAPFVPSVVFDEYLRWTTWSPALALAESAYMAVTSLLIAAALWYFVWRIQVILRG